MPSITRRVVLTGATGSLALVTGCDLLTGDGASGDPDASGSVRTTEPAVDADGELTDQVTASLARAAARANATGTEFAGLAATAERFEHLHRAHGRVLGGLPQVGRPDLPRRRKRARRDLLAAEERLQRELVAASMNAGSGALAQTFAAMAAALAQLRTAEDAR